MSSEQFTTQTVCPAQQPKIGYHRNDREVFPFKILIDFPMRKIARPYLHQDDPHSSLLDGEIRPHLHKSHNIVH